MENISPAKITPKKHRFAVAVIAALVLIAATVFFVGRGGEPPYRAGDIIEFGGHTWLVLDVQSDRMLIITEGIVRQQRHHPDSARVTWETSLVRRYLNTVFYNSFSAQDRAQIHETTLTTADNPWFGTAGGNDTVDKVFLLSLDELVKYFGDSGQLADRNHPNNGRLGFSDRYNSERAPRDAGWWWLRSPGNTAFSVAALYGGHVYVSGLPAQTGRGGLRPALWLYF